MKLWQKNLILLTIAIAIGVIPLLMIENSDFAGADSQATEIVSEIQPDFEPWANPIIELPGSEVEGLLFALQAAIGTGVVCFILGRMTANKGDSHVKN